MNVDRFGRERPGAMRTIMACLAPAAVVLAATLVFTTGAAMASPARPVGSDAVTATPAGSSICICQPPPDPETPSLTLSWTDANYLAGTVVIQGRNFTPGGIVNLEWFDNNFNSVGHGSVPADPYSPGLPCGEPPPPHVVSPLPCSTSGEFRFPVYGVQCGPGSLPNDPGFSVDATDSSGIVVESEILTPCQ
jgi:hypothetical protein